MELSEAETFGCTECQQCARQRIAPTWGGAPECREVLERACGGDAVGGSVRWATECSTPTKVMRWLCMVRGLDCGGEDEPESLRERLRNWETRLDMDPPPPYEERKLAAAAGESSREERWKCTIMTLEAEEKTVEESDEVEPIEAAVITVDGVRRKATFDTCAEVSGVRESIVSSEWTVISDMGIGMAGVGGGAGTGRWVAVPMQLRYGEETVWIKARVLADESMPEGLGVDVLVGKRALKSLGMRVDAANSRVEVRRTGTVIDVEPVEVIDMRMGSEPLDVLDLCAGVCSTYPVLYDLGWNVGRYDYVESDDQCAEVVEAMYPGAVRVGRQVIGFKPSRKYSMVINIGGPPCQPWSRADPHAKGFKDKRAKVFREVCRIAREVVRRNPSALKLVEN